MPTASECTYAIIYTIDDFTDTYNNLTLEFQFKTIEEFQIIYPTLRIFELVGTNFSLIIPTCYDTGSEFITYLNRLFVTVNNDFNKFLISYLFT